MFDFSMSGAGEWLPALAVAAVVSGLLLGYHLAGRPARAPEYPAAAEESPGQPLYAVVLHNDDYNTFAFVIGVLGKVFGYGPKGVCLTFKIHFTGRGVVWSGTFEEAELKAEQVRSCGADPNGRKGVQPLVVTVEPLAA